MEAKKPKIKTMQELSVAIGISRPTLSKYFHDSQSVRDKTRDRIEQALERYDYRPNIYAVNQNRRLTKTIGIVVPYLADPFFAEIARKIENRCIEAGFSPSLFSSHGQPDLEINILDNLRSLKPAGVLLAPLGRSSNNQQVERFCKDVPTVLFDSNIIGLGAAFVGSDNYNFVSQSVEYLCGSGDPPCFFEMRNPANPNANKRREAFITAMELQGIEPHTIRVEGEGWNFEEIGYAGAIKAIEERLLPTDTVLCSNDRLAIGFLAACYEKGLRVGREAGCSLRVAAHDDHPYSRFTCPSLTTVAHDYELVSSKSVETLVRLIDNGGRFQQRTEERFAARLVIRSSA
jgi:DNA-binding LacI/PurR family transcriptional regulator